MEENENKLIQATYFTKQNHSCMADYLIQQFEHNYSSEGVLLQILTYGPLLSKLAIYHMLQTLNVEQENCIDFNLQQFDTELDFCNAIR